MEHTIHLQYLAPLFLSSKPVAIHMSTHAAADDPPRLEVVFENVEMLVVNKPWDVPMDGDLKVYPHTVESLVYKYMKERGIFDDTHEQLQQEGKRKKQLKFVHQLDYSTSGVLCLAFTKDMAARLAHCFEMRTTRKYYLALLHGHIPNDTLLETPPASEERSSAPRDEKEPTHATSSTAFQDWVAQWNLQWKDKGSVQVDSCNGFPPKENSDALDAFRYLWQAPLMHNAEVETSESGQPVVHRHRAPARMSEAALQCPEIHNVDGDGSGSWIDNLIVNAFALSSACSLTVSLPVGYDAADPERFRMAVTTEQSRPASTSLLVLKRTYLGAKNTACSSAPVTLVLLSPHTGRRHQLRVHCRAIGCPIVGDTVYCADLPWCRPLCSLTSAPAWSHLPASRMYLHAWRLLLPGAVTAHVSEGERVALKKKRRRETLGLSERSDAALSAHAGEWTEFLAPVDFPGLELEK